MLGPAYIPKVLRPFFRKVPGFSRRELLLAAFERSAEDQEWLWMEPREAPPIPHPAS